MHPHHCMQAPDKLQRTLATLGREFGGFHDVDIRELCNVGGNTLGPRELRRTNSCTCMKSGPMTGGKSTQVVSGTWQSDLVARRGHHEIKVNVRMDVERHCYCQLVETSRVWSDG